MSIEEFLGEIMQGVVIQLKLPLEGPIGRARWRSRAITWSTTATKSTPSPPCLVLGLSAHTQRHHSISDGENAEGSTKGEGRRCVWCDAIGRSVAPGGSMARLCGHHVSTCAKAASV